MMKKTILDLKNLNKLYRGIRVVSYFSISIEQEKEMDMTRNIKFQLVSGDRAYAVWYAYNDFDVDMDTIIMLELDLNLIMGSSGEFVVNIILGDFENGIV